MENLKPQPIETEYHCPKTDRVMLLRKGRFGEFLGCSGYPECKKILKLNPDGTPVEGTNFVCGLDAPTAAPAVDPTTLPNATEHTCPAGHGGVMLLRSSRSGPFLGCSNYPKCHTILKVNPDGSLKEGQEFTCTFGTEPPRKGARTPRKTPPKPRTTGTRARKPPSTQE
jgi:DNA topoisomerase-1